MVTRRGRADVRLLPKEQWIKTSDVDCPTWLDSGLLGFVLWQRYRLLLELLGDVRYPRLLDIGYGSGMFMPELARHCDALYGVDVHDQAGPVKRVLAGAGVSARVCRGSGAYLPLASDSMDAMIAMSSLEFIDPFDAAARDFRRVLKPGGVLAVVTPGNSPILDVGLRMLTGRSANTDYGDRRRRIVPTLMREFEVVRRLSFPRVRPLPFHFYNAFLFRKR